MPVEEKPWNPERNRKAQMADALLVIPSFKASDFAD